MSWVWSDDLAALLIEHDDVARNALDAWLHYPHGHAVPDGMSPLEFARLLADAERDSAVLRRVS